MIVRVLAALKVVEAEVVAAIRARHVVAPLILVNRDLALGTLDCPGIFLPLIEQLLLFRVATFTPSVRFLTTHKAEL